MYLLYSDIYTIKPNIFNLSFIFVSNVGNDCSLMLIILYNVSRGVYIFISASQAAIDEQGFCTLPTELIISPLRFLFVWACGGPAQAHEGARLTV